MRVGEGGAGRRTGRRERKKSARPKERAARKNRPARPAPPRLTADETGGAGKGDLTLTHSPSPSLSPRLVSRALRSLGSALKSSLGAGKRPPTPAAAFEGYGKVVLALDDLAYEGVLDVTGREGRERAARLRGGAEA